MSEKIETPKKSRKLLVRILVPVLSVLLLLLIYGASFVALPVKILTNYRDRKCDTVISLNKVYTTLYPAIIRDASLSPFVKECDAYLLAVSNESNGKWTESYDAYRKYASDYPGGIYAKETYEHSASVLIHVIRDQFEQKQYGEAINNLNLIISNYSDTEASADAWILTPSVFTLWGVDLRDAGDFESSARVLDEYKSWAEHYQRNEVVPEAKHELAKTYIAWGLAQKASGQFEDAVVKFEFAAGIDPTDESKTAERTFYVEWGNALLEKKEFTSAIKKFEFAITLVGGGGEDAAKDALSNGYIQWADQLGSDEDYLGALDQLELAKRTAFTDEMKKSVDTAFTDTYTAFSNSSGNQAKNAMREAAQNLCEQQKEPELPIFGLSTASPHVFVYGVDATLPDELMAATPSQMKYVACVNEKQELVQRLDHSGFVTTLTGGYDHVQKIGNRYFVIISEYRFQLVWDITLRDVNTAKQIDTTTLLGSLPPPFTKTLMDFGSGTLFGDPPEIDQLEQWLQSQLKKQS